jgi:hypothetical protein
LFLIKKVYNNVDHGVHYGLGYSKVIYSVVMYLYCTSTVSTRFFYAKYTKSLKWGGFCEKSDLGFGVAAIFLETIWSLFSDGMFKIWVKLSFYMF